LLAELLIQQHQTGFAPPARRFTREAVSDACKRPQHFFQQVIAQQVRF